MKHGALVLIAALVAAPAVAKAQGMWWVEGDRFCSDFGNRSANGAMCGNARRGEIEPQPTFRFKFNSPRLPFLEDEGHQADTVLPAPAERPQRRRVQ